MAKKRKPAIATKPREKNAHRKMKSSLRKKSSRTTTAKKAPAKKTAKKNAPVKKLPERSEIPTEQKWDLEKIFPTDAAWEAAFSKVEASLSGFAKYEGKLGKDNGKHLLGVLQLIDEVFQLVEKVYVYASMRSDEDTANNAYQALDSRATTLYHKAGAACAFVDPEILTIPPKTIAAFLKSNKALQVYAFRLEKTERQRKYTLDSKTETLLIKSGEFAGGARNTFGLLTNADFQFPVVNDADGNAIQLSQGNYALFLDSPSQEVRGNAFRALLGTYNKVRNTLASLYATQVKADVFYARTRGHESALAATMYDNNVPMSVYDGLLATVEKNIPRLNRYVSLRKKALGVKELHMYDLYVPLIKTPCPKVTYDQAVDNIIAALAPLGKEYCTTLRRGFTTDRWVDRRETRGKRSGAYSGGCYGVDPYMLMNWHDELDQEFTLAHEGGHSMHSWYSRKHQPFVNADYTIFVAEVASTFNETLLAHHLLNTTTDPALRMHVINHILEGTRTTMIRQTMFAEFEKRAHEMEERGEALTADSICALWTDINKRFYGAHVVIDKEIEIEALRIPHFYNSFYVYKYATSLAAAKIAAKKVLTEGKPAVDAYLHFLQSGCSKYNLDLLLGIGADLRTPAPVEEALVEFEDYTAQLEDLLGFPSKPKSKTKRK